MDGELLYGDLPEDREQRWPLRGSVVFCRTRAEWGLFSNMAGGYPLRLGGALYPSSESLYQSLRFLPGRPDIATVVGQLPSGLSKSRAYESLELTRADWETARTDAMRLALALKASQHEAFRGALERSRDLAIVELSTHGDDFWGAVREDGGPLRGNNALGRMLMELRCLLRDGRDFLPEALERAGYRG